MLSPIFLPDLRVGSDVPCALEERSTLRRGGPERLRIDPLPPGAPRLTLRAVAGPPPGSSRAAADARPDAKPARRGGWLARLRLAPRAAAT